jgi:hypothetical protein
MHSRSQPSLLLFYFGAITTALAVTAVGLIAVVQASTGLSQATSREKTLLELQLESSRAIRQALAAPVVTPPLPPITARPAREFKAIAAASEQKKSMPAEPSQAAMNAMAMDLGGSRQSFGNNYHAADRHTAPY